MPSLFGHSRRALVAAAAALAAAPVTSARKKKSRRKRKKVKRNAFGCVNVGDFCKNGDQCCSGICEGKKDKKHCQAHDQSTCQAGQTVEDCGGLDVPCISSAGVSGACMTTTGNGAYCGVYRNCFRCSTDADCEPFFDPGSACIVCAVEECAEFGGTLCATPTFGS
jgi:hypothetical protein